MSTATLEKPTAQDQAPHEMHLTRAGEIQKQIAQLTARKSQLEADLRTAMGNLAAARQALIAGSGEASAVTIAQASHTALEQAIDSLNGQLQDLEIELTQEKQKAESGVLVARLAHWPTTARRRLPSATERSRHSPINCVNQLRPFWPTTKTWLKRSVNLCR